MNLGTPDAPLVQRESGVIVPGHLAHHAEHGETSGVTRDPDGRRRIVLVRDVRRKFARLAGELNGLDLAFVIVCKTTRQVSGTARDIETGTDVPVRLTEPIPGACGEVMLREGEGTPDPGFGCTCSRIHFTTGSV